MTFHEVEKILKADCWELIRISGSHHQYRKAGNPNSITLPKHNEKDLTIGILKDLAKKTGLSL